MKEFEQLINRACCILSGDEQTELRVKLDYWYKSIRDELVRQKTLTAQYMQKCARLEDKLELLGRSRNKLITHYRALVDHQLKGHDQMRVENSDLRENIYDLEQENKKLREALAGILTDADESWCTCDGEDDGLSPCGCYYHEAIEALSKIE